MSVYRLRPRENGNASKFWEASTIRPNNVWVDAMDEDDARYQVTCATMLKAGRGPLASLKSVLHTALQSPWRNPAMVSCRRDDSVRVPAGVICTDRGTMLPIRQNKTLRWPVADC